jgi:hypothetical protein
VDLMRNELSMGPKAGEIAAAKEAPLPSDEV